MSLKTYCTNVTRTSTQKPTERFQTILETKTEAEKLRARSLPFIGGGWAEEFWDLDESKLESSNPADIAGEGRAGGGVCRQALDHTYTVSTHDILDTSIRKGHARRVSAGMQHFTSARCIKLAGNKESQHSVPYNLETPFLTRVMSHQSFCLDNKCHRKLISDWRCLGDKIQLWPNWHI